MAEKINFCDTGETIYSMMDEFLVVCPKCGACGCIRRREPDNTDVFAPRRLVCEACGYTKDWNGRQLIIYRGQGEPAFDSVFQLPPWLQAPCCGKILWAYNPHHLEFIENYVQALRRSRSRDMEYGWRNKSLASRLPKWMVLAKNREAILKTIQRLKAIYPNKRSIHT